MATTVKQIFNKFGIHEFKKVKWGTTFNELKQGIYIVSTSDNPNLHLGICQTPQVNQNQINLWISKLPNFLIDNVQVDSKSLINRLNSFWLPDESILYIGKAPSRKDGNGISNRVIEYFNTIIGNGGPHSGGQWIKILKQLDSFTVYYAECNDPADVENRMLEFFMKNVSEETKSLLFDKNLPLPFANIKFKGNKKHGIRNQRL
jgi:hypothetical protein